MRRLTVPIATFATITGSAAIPSRSNGSRRSENGSFCDRSFAGIAQSAADFYYVTLDGTDIDPQEIPSGLAPYYSADYQDFGIRRLDLRAQGDLRGQRLAASRWSDRALRDERTRRVHLRLGLSEGHRHHGRRFGALLGTEFFP